jgi:hypothetical protein
VVSGLANGTPYTFVVTASNAAGRSATSTPSTLITPISPAGDPIDVTASGGNGRTTVSWAPPRFDGGSAITGYTVIAYPGGASCTTTTTSCVIDGLENGLGYTFTVEATNAAGTSLGARAQSVMHGAFSVLGHRQRLAGAIHVELELPAAGTVSLLGTHSDLGQTAAVAQDTYGPGADRFAYGRLSNIAIAPQGVDRAPGAGARHSRGAIAAPAREVRHAASCTRVDQLHPRGGSDAQGFAEREGPRHRSVDAEFGNVGWRTQRVGSGCGSKADAGSLSRSE